MVALRLVAPRSVVDANDARNPQRAPARAQTPAESRAAARVHTALPCWLMAESESRRGFVLELSETGARLGGVGQSYALGQQLLLKVALVQHEAPLVVRCEVARFAPRAAVSIAACADVCVHFVDGNLDAWFVIARHVDNARARLLARGADARR